MSNLCKDVGDVGLVERREREALLAEVVQRRADVDQGRLVDDKKTVVEAVRHPDRKRAAVLRIEPLNDDVMEKPAPRILHHENRYALPLLRDERQYAVREVRVDDDQLSPRHAHELLHLFECVVYLAVVVHLMRREPLVLHRVQNQLLPLLVAFLIGIILCLICNLPSLVCLNAGKKRRNGRERLAHGVECAHDLDVSRYRP